MTSVSALIVEIKALGNQFTSAFQGYKAKVQEFNESIKNGNEALTRLATGMMAFVGFEQLKKSVESADDLAGAIASLDQVLKSTGQYSAAASEELLKLADAEEQWTGVHKENVVQLESILFSYGATVEQVKKLTLMVLDFSTLWGRAPTMIARTLGEVTQGNTSALSTFGLSVSALGDKVKTFEGLMEVLGPRSKGQAHAMYIARGETDHFATSMHALRRSLGAVIEVPLGPFLARLNEALDSLTKHLQKILTASPEMLQDLKELGKDLGEIVLKIGPVVTALLAFKGVSLIFSPLIAILRTALFAFTEATKAALSFNVALGRISQSIGIMGAAWAGWDIGKFVAKLTVAGKSINDWAAEVFAIWRGWGAKVVAYLEYFWARTKEMFKTGLDGLVVLVRKSMLELAEAWNKVPFAPHINTVKMKDELARAIDTLGRDSSGRVAKAALNQRLADIEKETNAEIAAIEGLQKKHSDNAAKIVAAAPIIHPVASTSAKADADKAFAQIHKAFLQAGHADRQLLDAEYTAALKHLQSKLANDKRYTEAKLDLDMTYMAKLAALQKKEEEKQRQREAQEVENHRAALNGRLNLIQNNPLLTDNQKVALQLPIQRRLFELEGKRLETLKQIAANTPDPSARLEAERQITELTQQRAQLQQQITAEENRGSFGYQFRARLVEIKNNWTTWAMESAAAFKNAWQGATTAISGGLAHLMEYGAQRGQWFQQIWNGIVSSVVQSFTNMVTQWIMSHVIMQGVSRAFHAVLRMLRIQDVAEHAAGEAEKTGITVAGASKSIVAHAAVAGAGAAESQAGIPFVGPILAVAAMGAIFAAVMALAGGFAEGGFVTGPGTGKSDSILARLSAGEYVIPAERVRQWGVPFLDSIRSGVIRAQDLASLAAPAVGTIAVTQRGGGTGGRSASGQQMRVENAVYFDRAKLVDTLSKSDAHEKYIVDVMAKNIHRFR